MMKIEVFRSVYIPIYKYMYISVSILALIITYHPNVIVVHLLLLMSSKNAAGLRFNRTDVDASHD